MTAPLVLSRYRLEQFLVCRRRFQLRFVTALPWPLWPETPARQRAREVGDQFHRLLERHFLGLDPLAAAPSADAELKALWERFRRLGPRLPAGKRLAEYALTVPVGEAFLTGRFDLLVVDETRAHIYDWKTESEPRPEASLRADLQTRLYLALAVAGGPALTTDKRGVDPDALRITYWYVRAPEASVTLPYGEEAHRRNWVALEALVAELIAQHRSGDEVWPLTEDLDACARCAYRLFCGRSDVAPAPPSQRELVEEEKPSRSQDAEAW